VVMGNSSNHLALIFIPDISGFTKFVNDTEVKHSAHIIQELLENIINMNELQLTVSEIEGDAILFFRSGGPPDPEMIAAQVRKMFIAFHAYLNDIEARRVCQCGACSNASNLTLKFIIHYGNISVSEIGGHQKLLGKDVIVAHRLMKNTISDNEYMLISEEMISVIEEAKLGSACSWGKLNRGSSCYEHIGEVHYRYIKLAPLRKDIPEAAVNVPLEKYSDPIVTETFIEAPKEFIFETILDLDTRPIWTEGITKTEFDRDEILRIGSRHLCEVPGGMVELETIHRHSEDGTIEYAERAIENRLFKNVSTFYRLQDEDNRTYVRTEFHFKKRPLLGGVINLLFRPGLTSNLKKTSENLKQYCEESYHGRLRGRTQ